jgi:hypothetical protein
MVDFGKLPRTVIAAITKVCGDADLFVNKTKASTWANNVSYADLFLWERFLNIYSKGQSDEARLATILAYLNANGNTTVYWFYELAERLGYVRAKNVRREGDGWVWEFSGPHFGDPAVCFKDGQYLPFRTDIHKSADDGSGDIVYDNIDYGATTCTCYYRQGNAEDDLSLQLKDLISTAKNMGTKILFVRAGK